MHLRCNLLGAQDNFQGAENLHKGHPELVMLNAHVQLSLGNTEQALSLLTDSVIKAALNKASASNHQKMDVEGEKDEDKGKDEDEDTAEKKFPLAWQYLHNKHSQPASSSMIKDLAAELSTKLSIDTCLDVAFAFFLRPSCWVSRDKDQKIRPDAVTLAMPDFQLVEALVQPIVDAAPATSTQYSDLAARNLLVMSLCKSVHLLANTQSLLGQQATPEDTPSPESEA